MQGHGEPRRAGHRLRYLFAATAISVTGDGVLAAAAPLLAVSLTSDPFRVGLVSAAGFAAWLLIGLPSGALVDRSALRPVMIASDVWRAVTLSALVVAMVSGHASIWLLSMVVFALGAGSCFFDPAAQALIPAFAGRDRSELGRLNGLYWALDTLGRSLIGPPLGAWAFVWSSRLPFLADAISFVLSATLVSRLPRHGRASRAATGLVSAIGEGLRVLWHEHHLRAAALGMGAYNFGWSTANATLVLYATKQLKFTEQGFGFVLAAAAVGGVLGGLSHRVVGQAEIRWVYAGGLLLQSGAWALALVTGTAVGLFAAVVMVGFANTSVSTAGATTRQHHAPIEALGRVVSATRVIGVGANCLGSLAGGSLARWGGLLAPFGVSSVLLLVAGAWFAVRAWK
jgi:MFS family permease